MISSINLEMKIINPGIILPSFHLLLPSMPLNLTTAEILRSINVIEVI